MKKVLIILAGILLFVSIPVLVFFIGQRQELRSKAAPATTLAIQPRSPTVAYKDTSIWKIVIDTGANNVMQAKISLIFDQTKFEALSITNGALAPTIKAQGTVGLGTATITVAAESMAKPIHGSGEVAVLRLKAIGGSATPVTVQFASDTVVTGLGESTANVLTSTQPGSISIIGGPIQETTDGTTATPIPSGTLTPTPTGPTGTTTPTTSTTTTPTTVETASNTSSTLTVTVTEGTTPGKPIIKGTSPAGATVTIIIHSNPAQTQVVTATTESTWEATPQVALKNGTYSIVVTSLNPTTGGTETVSSTYTVTDNNTGGTTGDATVGEELPQSGSAEMTLVLLGISCCMMIFGGITLTKKYL